MAAFIPIKATGSHFYRYQSAEHLERLRPIILEHLLYAPSVAQLNDPTDCRPKLKVMSEQDIVTFLKTDYIRQNPVPALDLLQAHESRIRTDIRTHGVEWFQQQISSILNSHMETYRVYSLSKRYDNLSLWAKYANNHTGYCLEFLNEGLLFADHAFEVIYGDYIPFDVNVVETRKPVFLVHKRPEWSNEEEIRIIRKAGAEPFVKIEPQWLTRIILGKNMSQENQKQILEWATQRSPKLLIVNAYFDELHQEIRLK